MANDKGLILKQAREAKGISLDTVHESTKIPMDVLKAIEEGYTVRTLSPFYYKGFLKLYAQFLGVDVRDVIDSPVREALPVNPTVPAREAIQPILQERLSKVLSKKRKQQIVLAIGFVLMGFLVFKALAFVVHAIFNRKETTPLVRIQKEQARKAAKPKSKKEIQAEKDKEKALQAALAQAQKNPEKTSSAENGDQSRKTINLSVRAKKNTWLQVRVDGAVVFQAVMKKGISETWIAQKEIELSGKNINQLELELNGKMLGSLGQQDRLAKKVIITKDGLSVKK